jgi:hypothetical protein
MPVVPVLSAAVLAVLIGSAVATILVRRAS